MKKKKTLIITLIIVLVIALISALLYFYQKKYGEANKWYFQYRDYMYIAKSATEGYTDEELESFEKEYNVTFTNGKQLKLNDEDVYYFNFIGVRETESNIYYTPYALYQLQFKTSDIPAKKIIGRTAETPYEVVISNHYADVIMYHTNISETYEEFLQNHSTFIFDDQEYKIVGIIGYDTSKYQKLKGVATQEEYNLEEDYIRDVRKYYSAVYVTESFFENLSSNITIQNGRAYYKVNNLKDFYKFYFAMKK